MVGYNGPRRAQEGGHGAAHNGPRCVPQRLRGQGIAGRLDRGPGAAPRVPRADLLRPRDPGLQRLPTGGPWANVGDDTRQVPPGGPRNGPRHQADTPAGGQQTGGPQGGPENVAFAIKCDVPAMAPAGAAA